MTKTQGTVMMVLLTLVLVCLITNIVLILRFNPVQLSATNAEAYPVYLSQPVQLSKEDAPTWEYRIEGVPDLMWESTMREIGADGWELVFARRAQGENDKMLYETIFKRQTRG